MFHLVSVLTNSSQHGFIELTQALLRFAGLLDVPTPWPHSVRFLIVVTRLDTQLFPKFIERSRFQLATTNCLSITL